MIEMVLRTPLANAILVVENLSGGGAMTVRILRDGPKRSVWPRLVRPFAVTVAVLLIVAGVIGWAGIAADAYFLATSSAPASDFRQSNHIALAALPVAALIGLPLGIRLLRGRRRLVLFLRRFGFSDATRTMSFAANGVIGRSWRLVTLDDAAVTAVGGPRAPRQFARLAIIVAVAGGAVFTWWLLTRGMDVIYNKIKPASDASTPPGQAFGDAIGAPIAAAVLALMLWVMLVALITSSTVFMSATYIATRRAERAKKVRLNSAAEVRRRSSAIAKRGRRVFAPRLLVVAVANEVWRNAVSAFAQNSTVVIIDISIPSDNLRWEIGTLLPAMGRRCILVGRLDLLTRQGPDGRTVFASPLGTAIDGHDVLAYQPDGRGLRRFSRALQATIESRATR